MFNLNNMELISHTHTHTPMPWRLDISHKQFIALALLSVFDLHRRHIEFVWCSWTVWLPELGRYRTASLNVERDLK